MKKEVWRGQNSIRFLYLRYKDSPYYSLLVLIFVLLICFLLVFQIIVPQVNNWFSIRDEAIAMRQKIAVLRSNFTFISSLNKLTLENNRQTMIRALPAEKDFADIINAVAVTAVRSGVSVDDFSFNLGRISSTSADLVKSGEDLSSINLSLSLSGGVDRVKKFITEIGEKLPLSEVVSVDTSNSATSLSLLFYSKPYHLQNVPDEEPVRTISAENGSILGTLSNWSSSMNTAIEENPQPPASSSGMPLF
jgi:Tfp pilus assembly protein PilO